MLLQEPRPSEVLRLRSVLDRLDSSRSGLSLLYSLDSLFLLLVPNAVMSLRIQNQTNRSISLSWTAPMGSCVPSYTYWISWTLEDNSVTRVEHTVDINIILETLEPGSLYNFTVWAERNEVGGYSSSVLGATAKAWSNSDYSTIGILLY